MVEATHPKTVCHYKARQHPPQGYGRTLFLMKKYTHSKYLFIASTNALQLWQSAFHLWKCRCQVRLIAVLSR